MLQEGIRFLGKEIERRETDHAEADHVFEGFSFGYGGEGPRGMQEFLKIFGWNPKASKILEHGVFEDQRGVMNLKMFT